MKLQNLILLLPILALVACGPKKETIRLAGSPVEFRLEKGGAPGVYATYNGSNVPTSQIMEQNPVQTDLKVQENLIRLEYVLRKFAEDSKVTPGTTLNVYLTEPTKPNLGDLLKSWGIQINPKNKISFKQSPPDKDVIAQWGDQQVRASDVDASSVRLALVRTRAYKENLNRLKGIVVRRALLDAAKDEKMEIEPYTKKHITSDDAPVSDAEFDAFLAQSNIKKADINPSQEKALRNIALEKKKNTQVENYVVKHLLKGDIVVYEFPPSFRVQVPNGWEAIWGLKDAPVSVLYFGDLICGPCRDALKDVIQEKKNFNGNVKVGFNFMFSRGDRDSRMVSEGALCVQAQGKNYFRKLVEIYATHPPAVDESAMEQAVAKTGADVGAYKKCFLAREHQNLLNQHLDFASRVGVTSLPTVLVDGEPMEGAIVPSDLHELIERKVEAKTTFLGSMWRKARSLFTDN